jgi:hypothetical protein
MTNIRETPRITLHEISSPDLKLLHAEAYRHDSYHASDDPFRRLDHMLVSLGDSAAYE